jgi:hypothetical protein
VQVNAEPEPATHEPPFVHGDGLHGLDAPPEHAVTVMVPVRKGWIRQKYENDPTELKVNEKESPKFRIPLSNKRTGGLGE